MQANATTALATEPAGNDIGPLAWVLDELHKSLDGATKAIRRFVRDAEMARGTELESIDASQLRIARQQLHQAVGALEMVGLEGPAKVLRGMEALAKKFVEHPELCSEDAAEKVERASFALIEYLESVIRGKSVSAVALFPQYREVLGLVGEERIHPADLWTPEWRWIDVALPARTAPLAYEPSVRARMDPAVLQIVKTGSVSSAKELRDISLGFAAGAQAVEARVFWKICAAFFEALSLNLCPADVYVKRAASRLLMQYATLARGDQSVSDRLAQDLLFFCAQSAPASEASAPVLSAVRNAYGLAQYPVVNYETVQYGRFDPSVLVQARKRIATATETWSSLCGGDLNRLKVVSDQFNAVSESIIKLHPESIDLARAFNKAVELTQRSGEAPSTALGMEVATAILYLDAAYEDLEPVGGQMAERSRRLAQRLEHVMRGGQPEALEGWMEELYRRVSDRQTMGSVVDELRTALAEVEKSLDQYFRSPQDKQHLQEVPNQLGQMRGVFSVLGLDQASLATLRMRDTVEKLMVDGIDAKSRPAAFEKLGNSLGALGFLIDMLSYQRSLAKKLFVYDDVLGEFKPLMGREKETPHAPVAAQPVVTPAPGAPAKVEPVAAPVAAPTAPAKVASPKPAAQAVEEDDDETEVREIFLDEARDVVGNGLEALASLGSDPGDLSQQTTLRRAFHTLKGSSRMVGLTEFGEAAWAMEQLLNSWLAEQKPASTELLQLAKEAMQGFGRWVGDIANNADEHWSAAPFRKSADAMRLDAKVVALEVPGASAQDEDSQTDFQPTQMFDLEDDDFVEPQGAAPGAAEAGLASFEIDFSSLGGLSASGPDAPASPGAQEEITSPSKLEAFALEPAPDAFEATASFAAAKFEKPLKPQALSLEPAPAPDAFDTTVSFSAAKFDKPLEFSVSPEFEPTALGGGDAATGAAELPSDFELELPSLELSPAPVAKPAPPAAVQPAPASPRSTAEEQVKVIGNLRIGIPLYNVFLNEADEWSRRLQMEVGEWALELHRPIGDAAVALAHSLSGSSATVGFKALSQIARLLEMALMHAQLQPVGSPEQAQVFVAAADDIRHLLHQFAAGFLNEPDPKVINALQSILNQTTAPTRIRPRQDEPHFPAIEIPDLGELIEEKPATSEPKLEDDAFSLDFVSPTPEPAPAAANAQVPASMISRTAFQPGAAKIVVEARDDDIDAVDTIDPDLFPIFEEEAAELLPLLGGALRKWSSQPDDGGARAEVLRVLHTLKGSARLAGAMRLGEMAHRMESAIEQMGSESVQASQIEPMLTRFDALNQAFVVLCAGGAEAPVEGLSTANAVETHAQAPGANRQAALAQLSAQSKPMASVLASTRQSAGQSVRVRSQLLDRLLNQAGEVMITRSRLDANLGQLRGSLGDLTGNLDRLRQHLRDIELHAEMQMQSRLAQAKETAQGFDPLEFDRFTRVQELTRMMAESVNDVATVQRNLQRTMEGTEDDLVTQGRQTRELQRDLLRTRMIEFEAISERLYGVVRQASKDAGKQVKLDISGGTLELDRGVLERMAPAFEHMLRNSVAHGVEESAVRLAAGKPAAGTITIELHHEGNDVSVTFSDDGAGLNLARIREKAKGSGLVPEGAVLSDAQACNLIFMPGFSTASQVTELSGRGIGMDVVRSEINALGGRIETSTEAGKGTRFKLVLPLTTAVTQVIMLRMGNQAIGVPANLVEIVRRTPTAELQKAYAAGHYDYAGEDIPFFWAGALLQTSASSQEVHGKSHPVVIFRSAGQRLAAHVDEVLGNQEVVVKNLGPQLSQLPGLAGMSVLASGAVVLIYNPVALATVYGDKVRELQLGGRQAEQRLQSPLQKQDASAGSALAAGGALPLVLVVDDSITVRRVTQRLLKREGYRVALAADGLQALERLQEEKPTVVLSDIEMPRMDGFDLVRNIRADANLRDLPIIMITSRIAEKHREHARELGVNHYLGKPFSEEELLNLVKHYCALAVEA